NRMSHTFRSMAVVCGVVWAAGGSGALAFQAEKEPGLPNFDLRQAGADQFAQQDPARRAAFGHFRARVPDAGMDSDETVRAPRRVLARRGYLSGPKGEGRGVPAEVAREFPREDPQRGAKAFLKEHRALFGHGPEALAAARIKREFVTAHNGLKTVVWE